MKDWRALPSKGGLIGIVLTGLLVALLGVAIWLTWQAANATEIVQSVVVEDAPPDAQPELYIIHTGTNFGTFGLALLCAGLLVGVLALAYQVRRFFKLRYALDRNAITIDTGDRKQVIPLANVRYVIPAATVLTQMRNRVYGPETTPGSVPLSSTGPAVTAYPRPSVGGEASETSQQAVGTEVAPDESVPAYFMTSTAAADSSLERLEKIEIVEAEVVEEQSEDKAQTAHAYKAQDEVVEGQITELEPAQFRALAIDFDMDKPPRQEVPPSPNTTSEKAQTPYFQGDGSVNFQVKAQPFSWWPGFYFNKAQVNTLGPVQFYSTQPLAKTLLVRTDQRTYAISPTDSQQFMTEYKLRRRLGAIEAVQEEVVRGAFLSHPLWHDKLGRGLILAGVVLNLLLYVYLLWRFSSLPEIMQMHFNKFGKVDRVAERGELLVLPFIGLLALVGNSLLGAFLHPKERVPAYLLYAGAILLQMLTAIAVLVILAVSGTN